MSSVTIVYASSDVPHVRPWVQAFADEGQYAASMTKFMTYNGHSPSAQLALDCFPRNHDEGTKFAHWATQPEIMARFGIDYVIWSLDDKVGWIFNPEVVPYWREMRDRGGVTANHRDHDHVSFNSTAPARPGTSPTEDHDMLVIFNQKGQGFLFTNGKLKVLTGEQAGALSRAGVPRKDMSNADVDVLYEL